MTCSSDESDDPFGLRSCRRARACDAAAVTSHADSSDDDPIGLVASRRASLRDAARIRHGACIDNVQLEAALRVPSVPTTNTASGSASSTPPRDAVPVQTAHVVRVTPSVVTATPSRVCPPSTVHAKGDARSMPYPMPSGSHTAIVAARADRERHEQVLLDEARARGARRRLNGTRSGVTPTAPAGELMPLTGKPVADPNGLTYPPWVFQSQLDLACRDPFLDVALTPPSQTLPDACVAVHDRVRDWIAAQPFDLIFTIGITRGPTMRFHRRDYGYWVKGYDRMYVLYCGPPHWVGELERSLITYWKDRRGCQNSNPGGENCPPSGVGGWLYVAYTTLDSDRDLNVRMARRRVCDSALGRASQAMLDMSSEHAVPDLMEGRR
jgi:hypothetical protein